MTLDKAASILDGACATVAAKRVRVRENDAPLGAVTISAEIIAIRQRDVRMASDAALCQSRLAKERRQAVSIEGRLVDVSYTTE